MKRKKFLVKIIILLATFITLVYVFININVNKQEINSNENTISKQINRKESNDNKYIKEAVIEEYKGFDVCAKLEIPSINLETYVLENYSENALNISVVKFYGADPNVVGNFCIAGHNFINKNMFRNLKNVEIGERLIISDNNIGKIEYEVTDIYKVVPENTSCLSQNTNGEREVTLITCTTSSKERIIVKAREVN